MSSNIGQKVNNPTDISKQERSKGQQSNWYQQTKTVKRSTIQLISTNKNVQKVNNPTDIYKSTNHVKNNRHCIPKNNNLTI